MVADLQEPRAAVAAGDYLRATQALDGMKERVEKVVADVAAATTSQTSRRRR
jgi:tetrahydromethanopterin S-methyltransferase subunit G